MTKTLTPAQQQGFEIGKLYRVFQVSEGSEDFTKVGQIVKFVRDDDTLCPEFQEILSGQRTFVYLADIEPCNQESVETTYTIKKLSNQEILLMYVKQHYPEDRVMIAMVESI